MDQLGIFDSNEKPKEESSKKPHLSAVVGNGIERTKDYQDYIRSAQWKAIRQVMLKRADGRCENCSSRLNLEVHHKHYETFKRESFSDLKVLCRSCHRVADQARERRVARELKDLREEQRLANAAETYLDKVYGEGFREQWMYDEFDEWLERKQLDGY